MNFRMANSQPTACANFFEPNQTCGFVRVSYASEQKAATKLRPIESALYFLVTPQAPVWLHRIRNDQLYHYYRGDPPELLLLKFDGSSEKAIIGADLAAGEHVQFFIPVGTFHTVRMIGQRRWFLGSSTEWPAVIPADVELGDAEVLAKKYPHVAEEIRSFAQESKARSLTLPVAPARPSTWRATPSCRPCRRR
jgi:predicted cupin superfamily sugar epimerase